MGGRRGDGDPRGSEPSVEIVSVSEIDEFGRSPRRRLGRTGVAVAALVGVVAAAVAVVATSPGGSDHTTSRRVVSSPAARALFAALGETTGAGSYDATYTFHATQGSTSRAPAVPCPVVSRSAQSSTATSSRDATSTTLGRCLMTLPNRDVTITGHATINTDPYRMVATSEVSGLGAVTIRVDGSHLWETGGGYYGVEPGRDAGPGSTLSGFAGLVGGTLGAGQGALTMITLASPNGYLNLEKQAVSGVTPAGGGTVDGASVLYYEVAIDVAKILDVPGLTGEQSKTVTEALAQLGRAGYRGTTVKVGVDEAGFIRETTSVAEFADGSRMTSHTVLSNFGCAGTVRLPGDPPTTTSPVSCVSPDTTTTAPAATTTTTPNTTARETPASSTPPSSSSNTGSSSTSTSTTPPAT